MYLKEANKALRDHQFAMAMRNYVDVLWRSPGLSHLVRQNMAMTARMFRASRGNRLRVGVAGWSMTHNAAGRAYALASLYQKFADVELVGALFPKYGDGVWAPIANSGIPIYVFRADDQRRFIRQAMDLVAEHPYDVVHLAKPRMPNILFGLSMTTKSDAFGVFCDQVL